MTEILMNGTVLKTPEFSHECMGEKMYYFDLGVDRVSNNTDIIPCYIPKVFVDQLEDDMRISVTGEIRTTNYSDDGGNKHLKVYVFVKSIEEYDGEDFQEVYINGYVCRDTIYRKTPLGREITDLLVASHRERSPKSDYIPCIAWGRNALRSSKLKIGQHIEIVGRFQGREYSKTLEDGTKEIRTAYEVSAQSFVELDD